MELVNLFPDVLRDQEMEKYYRAHLLATSNRNPVGETSSNSIMATSITTALLDNPVMMAFAQLVALQLNADRAIISLIDRKYQYILAESKNSRGLKLDDYNKDVMDMPWPGSARVPTDNLPCGQTIALQTVPGDSSVFVVPDLSTDMRFNKLPGVSGPPFLRFYAGVPIKTSDGVPIGSLFVVHSAVRPRLSPDQEQFLKQMSLDIMQNLETCQMADEGRRRKMMDQGLNALFENRFLATSTSPIISPSKSVDPGLREMLGAVEQGLDKTADPKTTGTPSTPLPNIRDEHVDFHSGDILPPASSEVPSLRRNNYSSLLDKEKISSQEYSTIDVVEPSEKDSMSRVLGRAAKILYRTLQLKDSGGVAFLDNSVTANEPGMTDASFRPSTIDSSRQRKDEKVVPGKKPSKNNVIDIGMHPSDNDTKVNSKKPLLPGHLDSDTRVLGFYAATTFEAGIGENSAYGSFFIPLKSRGLARLAGLYPRGMLWSLDEKSELPTAERHYHRSIGSKFSEEYAQTNFFILKGPTCPESELLSHHFGRAPQILFVPLSESASNNTGCFVWSGADTSWWSWDPELVFCANFAYCVMAEIAKIDTIAADRRQKDFIGSISHELRSPLHGILASAEFLDETRTDVFQKSLIDTVGSCGRTLLDTINHVLDFSKINSFGKGWPEVDPQQPEQAAGAPSTSGGALAASTGFKTGALLNICSETNVAVVCEEVVEGLFVGHHFRETSSIDFTDTTTGAGGRNPVFGSSGTRQFQSEVIDSLEGGRNKVEMVLNIEKRDWRFITQPGALRRVIMNIVGNAMKYTERGWVEVKLEAQEINGDSQPGLSGSIIRDSCIVILTVTDSGKGISENFIRTRLYTAFAQEDVLTPGTGLGLSLVRSIVSMLKGTIDIRSRVGSGTEVKVCLPMERVAQETGSPKSHSIISAGISHHESDSIAVLRQLAQGKTVALFGFDSNAMVTSISKSIGDTLAHYVTDWFGLQKVSTWSSSSQADILIADEVDMPALLAHGPKFPGSLAGPLLVILCSDAIRYGQTTVYAAGGGVIEFVTKPVGPHKLAKALRHCLCRANEAKATPTELLIPTLPANAVYSRATLDNLSSGSIPRPESSMETSTKRVPPLNAISNHSDSQLVVIGEKGDRSADAAAMFPKVFTQESRNTSPVVLLVDDNVINLRLLQMFMQKRSYTMVDSATNGQLAVQAVERSSGYDIIFMDISMPILNGFDATRAIRKIEACRRDTLGKVATNSSSSLIIALTGLASVTDQTEAFAAGIDLYMAKPVSFRDVGELLDDWELHGRDGFRSKAEI